VSSSNISRSACQIALLLCALLGTATAQPAIDTAEVAVRGPDGATLFVDGKQLGVLPLSDTVILAAGAHRFQLQVAARKLESDALQLPPNRMAELHLSLSNRGLVAVMHLTPVLLLRLEPAGLPQALVDAIWQAVASAARVEHTMLLRRDRQAALSQKTPALIRCLDGDDCHEALFQNGEVSFVLALKIDKEGADLSPDYALHAALLDVRARDDSLRADERCAACTISAVAMQLGKITGRMLRETLQRARGTLELASTPDGAKVFVDGKWLGQTPLRQELFAGTHSIDLEREGYQTATRRLTVEAGQGASVSLTMSRAPLPSPARRAERPRSLGRLITGSVLLGGGLLVGGFGISGLVMNVQCLDGSEQLDSCSPVLNTRAVGSALLASGAVLAVTGTLVLAIPERRRKLLAQASSWR
jgi:hypothetical protein